jgi:hypothetical protein
MIQLVKITLINILIAQVKITFLNLVIINQLMERLAKRLEDLEQNMLEGIIGKTGHTFGDIIEVNVISCLRDCLILLLLRINSIKVILRYYINISITIADI